MNAISSKYRESRQDGTHKVVHRTCFLMVFFNGVGLISSEGRQRLSGRGFFYSSLRDIPFLLSLAWPPHFIDRRPGIPY